MRAYQSSTMRDDQYMIVIAGDAWLISGDADMSDGGEYVGEFIRQLAYESTQIDPKTLPRAVVYTAKIIARIYYAHDWRDFCAYPNTQERG